MKECMLTTIDNPYDPFEQFDEWFQFDVSHGYDTCAYLGRMAGTSNRMSDEENFDEIERAIDGIIAVDPFNMYRKVSRTVEFEDLHNISAK